MVPANNRKLIEEHTGLASTGEGNISIARMIAPPGWSEPHQTPAFDEYTLVCSGKKLIEVKDEQIILESGQSILIKVAHGYATPILLMRNVNTGVFVCRPSLLNLSTEKIRK